MDLLNIFLIATSVCAFVYAIQLFYLDRIRLRGGTIAETTSRKRAHLLRAIAVVCSILGALALVLVPIFGKPVSEACSREHQEINPDVGGIGVLLGLFLPCLVLLVVLILGHFTVHTSGAKELCMAQCANLSYLAVNLLKGKSALNSQELVIALSSIDAVSASISMAFSDKDVLAARKLVSFGFVMQIFGYVVQGVAFGEYTRRHKFQCGASTWDQLSSQHYSTAYWIYYSFRIVASILPCPVAFRLTSSLNKIENKHNSARSERVKATALWGSLPATVATSYLIYWPFVLLHGLSIFNVLRGTDTINRSWDSLIGEWGQSANAIIAVFAIGHVAYAICRIFVAESTDDDGRTSAVSARSISHAYPQQGWLRWPWRACTWIKQSWPFSHGLDYPDHLLVDQSMLQAILDPPLQQTPKVRKQLHEELMDGFDSYEPDTVLDCLDRGAPLDEPNDDGDYPIHLAAHNNNIDILMRTRFKFTKDSVTHDSLLLKNSASETPLEIACKNGTLKAVRWIMERLPQTRTETRDVVGQAFELAILGQRLGVLSILQDLWPAWRILEIQLGLRSVSLLHFAIQERKPRAAYELIDPIVITKRHKSAPRIFELAWKAQLDVYDTEVILDNRQDELTNRNVGLIERVMGSAAVDNTETLELLLALDMNALAILRVSIEYSVRPGSCHDEEGSMWEHILQAGYTFEPIDLDSILTFDIPIDDEVTDAVPPHLDKSILDSCFEDRVQIQELELQQSRVGLQKDRIKKALIRRGGCDWSKTAKACQVACMEDLENLIKSETDNVVLQRMLNVKDGNKDTLLKRAIKGCWQREVRRIWEGEISKVRSLQYIAIIELLLEHGSCVEDTDLWWVARGARYGGITLFMLLAAHTKGNVASASLRTMCSTIQSRGPSSYNSYEMIQVLLRTGANPTIRNESGKLPRQDVYDKDKWVQVENLLLFRIKKRGDFSRILDLLQRWEDYYNDPQTGKPSERPDDDWKAVRDDLGDEATWAWLVEKNPEGYKVVES